MMKVEKYRFLSHKQCCSKLAATKLVLVLRYTDIMSHGIPIFNIGIPKKRTDIDFGIPISKHVPIFSVYRFSENCKSVYHLPRIGIPILKNVNIGIPWDTWYTDKRYTYIEKNVPINVPIRNLVYRKTFQYLDKSIKRYTESLFRYTELMKFTVYSLNTVYQCTRPVYRYYNSMYQYPISVYRINEIYSILP